jgi:hypothetical protein
LPEWKPLRDLRRSWVMRRPAVISQIRGLLLERYFDGANAYRIQPEENKPATERGYYLHPELFGEPASESIQAAKKFRVSSESTCSCLAQVRFQLSARARLVQEESYP